MRAEIAGFVDPGLRRVDLTWEDLDLPDRLESIARRTWEALDKLPGSGQESADVLGELDRLHEEYAAYYLEAEVVSRSTRDRRPARACAASRTSRATERGPRTYRRARVGLPLGATDAGVAAPDRAGRGAGQGPRAE